MLPSSLAASVAAQSIIFEPVLVMLLLTAVVWVWLFARRLPFMLGNKIDAEAVKTPQQLAELLPPKVAAPGDNLKNLFEVPVIFYVVCISAFLLQQVDGLLVNCAWAFVGLRAVHSIVHCTYNRVMHRFLAYLLSCIVLGCMLVKLSLSVLY